MTEQQPPFTDAETPTIEVRVYRDDQLIDRILCESDEAASNEIERWSELPGISCVVDDLSFRHRPGDVLEPVPAESVDDDYPTDAEHHWAV